VKFLRKAWLRVLGLFAVLILIGEGANLLLGWGIQRWVIPTWVLLLVLILLILIIVFFAISVNDEIGKRGGVSQEEFDKLKEAFIANIEEVNRSLSDLDQGRRDLQEIVTNIYNRITNPKRESDLEPNDEILTILAVPATNASQYTTRSNLNIIYERTYKGKNQADLNILIDALKDAGLIRVHGSYAGEEVIEITSKGLKYYDAHRKKGA
jgi:hypothetical protein